MSRIQDRTGIVSEVQPGVYNKAVHAADTVANIQMNRRLVHLTSFAGSYTPAMEKAIDELIEVNTSEPDSDFEGADFKRRADKNRQADAAKTLIELRSTFHCEDQQAEINDDEFEDEEWEDDFDSDDDDSEDENEDE